MLTCQWRIQLDNKSKAACLNLVDCRYFGHTNVVGGPDEPHACFNCKNWNKLEVYQYFKYKSKLFCYIYAMFKINFWTLHLYSMAQCSSHTQELQWAQVELSHLVFVDTSCVFLTFWDSKTWTSCRQCYHEALSRIDF